MNVLEFCFFSLNILDVIRKTLRLPNFDPVEIDSKSFPNFDVN